jgi:hypothetical protein
MARKQTASFRFDLIRLTGMLGYLDESYTVRTNRDAEANCHAEARGGRHRNQLRWTRPAWYYLAGRTLFIVPDNR